MNVSRFPVTPRECCACRSPLKPGERDVCRQCGPNDDLYPAARDEDSALRPRVELKEGLFGVRITGTTGCPQRPGRSPPAA